MSVLVSRATRNAFREFCSGWLVLRQIDDAFRGHGFIPDSDAQPDVGGQRRALVEEFYAGVDWGSTDHVRRFLLVIEDALDMARMSTPDETALPNALAGLARALGRDGLLLDLDSFTIEAQVELSLTDLDPHELLNPAVLQKYVREMREAADTRPGAAIDAAKNLIEAASKLVLDKLEVAYPKNPKMPGLLAQVQETLGLHAKLVADDAKAADDIRSTLGGLLQVGLGIANLRNHYGDGHGRTDLPVGLQPRHAHLAIGAADTYARFILATLAERQPDPS